MGTESVLDGKWLLIVDDEPDVLETLVHSREELEKIL